MMPTVRLVLLLLILGIPQLLSAQVVDHEVHRVVFHVARGETADQEQVIGQLNNILRALPNAEIEVVCQGPGLSLLHQTQSEVKDGVIDLLSRGVVFAACENTMRKVNVKKDDLISGVTTVPSALVEIIIRQEQGWPYIKAGN